MNSDVQIEKDIEKEARHFEPYVPAVKDILFDSDPLLRVPEFQRPYKWTPKHVKQLIEDIVVHFHKGISSYRIGTAVMYYDNEDKRRDVVDGQQRLITLSLIAYALLTEENTKEFASRFGKPQKLTLLNNNAFTSSVTKENVLLNYNEIKREISNFSNDEIRFFFEKCELVCITRTDISEAFQFFDSQNARGKDLDPHDLLKAYHLREMSGASEQELKGYVENWENEKDEDLNELFGQYWFRIRRWSKRRPARFLTKSNADVFKGVSLKKVNNYSYVYPLKINDVYTDEYNQHPHRKIDEDHKPYPFQVDQVVINGKRFFEMTSFYLEKVKLIRQTRKSDFRDNQPEDKREEATREFLPKLDFLNINDPESISFKIFRDLSYYEGKGRQGDRYVRILFDSALLYYTDKFGNVELERVIPKLFVWAYYLRLDHQSVQLASADTYAIGHNSMFTIIREATEPKDVYQVYIPKLEDARSSKTDLVEALFIDLKYLGNE